MKRSLVFLVVICLSSVAYSQSINEVVGVYELKDTLSSQKTDFGGVVVWKHKVLHKILELKNDNTFDVEHLKPSGYHIDANYKGTWEQKGGVLLLSYLINNTDDNGKVVNKQAIDKYYIEPNGDLKVMMQGSLRYYKKSVSQSE